MSRPPIQAILLDSVGVTLVPSPRYLHDDMVDEIDAVGQIVIDEADFWRRVRRRFALDEPGLAAAQAGVAGKYCRNLNLWAHLPFLRSRARLVLVHAGPGALVPHWRGRFDLDAAFEPVIVASNLSRSPGEPAFYERTAALLNLPPSACLAVNDELEPVAAARDAGCAVYRYGSASGLVQALAALSP